MKLGVFGPIVRHALLIMDAETGRHPIIRRGRFLGGVALIKDLVRRISPTPLEIVSHGPAGRQALETFAECRQYVPVLGGKGENGDLAELVHRVDKLHGQTEIDLEYKFNVGDREIDMLVLEVPEVGSDDKLKRSLNDLPFVQGRLANGGWAIVKTDSPHYFNSNLFRTINSISNNQQILVMSLSTVRKLTAGPVIGALSWESIAFGIQKALTKTRPGETCVWPHALIVSITNDGAACLKCEGDNKTFTLCYDPKSIDGEWLRARPGQMAGYTQCIAAAVAAGLIEDRSSVRLHKWIQAGVHGGRCLHREGYKVGLPEDGTLPLKFPRDIFPAEQVARAIRDAMIPKPSGTTLHTTEIPASENEVNWSILRQNVLDNHPSGWPDVRRKMIDLVRDGIDELLKKVPLVSFGDLTAVLREEIEGLRAIHRLMSEYNARSVNRRPLSIAVFGAPGSGKSFSVKCVAQAIDGGHREFETLEFNLSQFSEPEQLYAALHQVRDSALSGKMPLVFWDEFDCDFHEPYGWLRYFLAPMQDGKFTQGESTHSVGNAVFVFAGGRATQMDEFRADVGSNRALKGPDFLSRLQGFLNVAGLDHDDDILLGGVLVRRAILLRSLLFKYAPNIARGRKETKSKYLDIDDAIVSAFLCTKRFRYGARSIETILAMSSLHGKTRFEPSFLPSPEQIHLHVENEEWLDLIDGSADMLQPKEPSSPVGRIGW